MKSFKVFFFLWLVLITILSTMPSVQLPNFSLFSADKLAHTLVYGVLTWLGARGFSTAQMPNVGFICVFSFGYGVAMEYVQYAFIPGRSYEYDDMAANGLGVILAYFYVKTINIRR